MIKLGVLGLKQVHGELPLGSLGGLVALAGQAVVPRPHPVWLKLGLLPVAEGVLGAVLAEEVLVVVLA